MKAKKHGWVIEILPKSEWYDSEGRNFYTSCFGYYASTLINACVWPTRKDARYVCSSHEAVRKVRLNSKGVPVAIIGRG